MVGLFIGQGLKLTLAWRRGVKVLKGSGKNQGKVDREEMGLWIMDMIVKPMNETQGCMNFTLR